VPLAITQAAPQLPGVPTLAQAGYPRVEGMASFSVAVPTGTPPAVIQRLSVEINRAMKSPAFREKLDAQALIPMFDTPEDFAAALKRERQRWAEVIRRNGITVE
jgi:tripartite-type tricarboxylate transporter receptor subunit TctC